MCNRVNVYKKSGLVISLSKKDFILTIKYKLYFIHLMYNLYLIRLKDEIDYNAILCVHLYSKKAYYNF